MFIAKLGEAISNPAGVPQALGFIPSIIADSPASLYLDFADLTRMWKESAGTNLVTASGDLIGKASSPYGTGYAFQGTAGQLGTYQSAGGGVWRGDGSNDWLDTANFLFAASGGNTAAMKITPNSGSAGRTFFGFSSSNRFALGLNASGFLLASYGTVATAILGSVDVRSTTFIVTLTHDGTNLYLYRDNVLVGSTPLSGVHATTFTPAIGAARPGTGGAPTGGWTGCDIRKVMLLSGRYVTAAEVANIVAAFG
ncbi:LamG-like jellyroll fold domain-containing protein [Mesorhizobium sp. M1403]|uniref:LamG-like jellyroll fold domain-containing protein n=1 Tax=Mesorhizobium sp. M1403 TaxID=2957097 RepID=UPI003335E218